MLHIQVCAQGVTAVSVGESETERQREHAWDNSSFTAIITRKEREREEDRLSRLNTTVVLILWADRFRWKKKKNYWFGEEQPYCMDLWWNNKSQWSGNKRSSEGNIQTSRSAQQPGWRYFYSTLFCLIRLSPVYYLFILLFR